MQPTLSFEQAPPISVPYRFFLTAPLFGVLAGLILAWYGADAMASRWSSGALAMTHLIVVDFMLQAMVGSLLQIVAVVAGANIWRPTLVATVVHPLITAGAVMLASAFVFEQPFLFIMAAGIFAIALGFFLTVMLLALLRTPATGMPVHVLRIALVGLLITAAIGFTLAMSLGLQDESLPLGLLVNVHVAWGLGGWALMLVIGVSYLVVPMFQLTPAYPAWLTRVLPLGLLAVICLWSLQIGASGGEPQPWQVWVALAGMLLLGLYGGTTLWLQSRRRRRQTDVTFLFWRVAMSSLIAYALSWIVFMIFPELGAIPRTALWLGVLALPGVFLSVIIGMLYKIVPFLNWLHLQRIGDPRTPPPNMKQMIPEKWMKRQMWMHFAALGLLLAAVVWPLLAPSAGIVFAASCALLEWNLIVAVRRYEEFRVRILAAVAGRGS